MGDNDNGVVVVLCRNSGLCRFIHLWVDEAGRSPGSSPLLVVRYVSTLALPAFKCVEGQY